MPLLGRKVHSFSPQPDLKNLDDSTELFVIRFTNEVFLTYEDYLQHISTYLERSWTCKITGKGGLTYEQALASEKTVGEATLKECPTEILPKVLESIEGTDLSLAQLTDQIYALFQEENPAPITKSKTPFSKVWIRLLIKSVAERKENEWEVHKDFRALAKLSSPTKGSKRKLANGSSGSNKRRKNGLQEDTLLEPRKEAPEYPSYESFAIPSDCLDSIVFIWKFVKRFGKSIKLYPFDIETLAEDLVNATNRENTSHLVEQLFLSLLQVIVGEYAGAQELDINNRPLPSSSWCAILSSSSWPYILTSVISKECHGEENGGFYTERRLDHDESIPGLLEKLSIEEDEEKEEEEEEKEKEKEEEEPFFALDPKDKALAAKALCEVLLGSAVIKEELDKSVVDIKEIGKEHRRVERIVIKGGDDEQAKRHQISYQNKVQKVCLREIPLGQDRELNRYWDFMISKGKLVVEQPSGKWFYFNKKEQIEQLLLFLDPRGIRESHLLSVLKEMESTIMTKIKKREDEERAKELALSSTRRSSRIKDLRVVEEMANRYFNKYAD